MKYLSDYTGPLQTKLFEKTGTFFAFSKEQYEDQHIEGIKYTYLDAGLVVPEANAGFLVQGLEMIQKEGIKQDINENGIKAIIHRELANHEAQITNDITDTVEALEDYPITAEDVQAEWKEYFQMCIDNDYF